MELVHTPLCRLYQYGKQLLVGLAQLRKNHAMLARLFGLN